MEFIKKSAILFILMPLLAFGLHKYYISFTKIDYSEKSKSLQIIMRVFTDDLQNGLEKQFLIKTELDTDKEHPETNTYIEKYVTGKFIVKVNGEKTPTVYIGKKYDADETKLYLEIEEISSVKNIEVQNNVLMELFEDQQNIIKIKINNKKK